METFSICSPTIHFRLLNDKSSNFPCICFCFILDFYLNMLILLKSRPRDHVKSFSSEIYDLSSGLWTAFASGSFWFFDCALDGDKACLHDKMDEIWTRFFPRHFESFDVTIWQSDYNHRLCWGFFSNDAVFLLFSENMLEMPSLPHTTLHCSNRSIIIYANEFVSSFAERLPLFSKELLRLNGKWKWNGDECFSVEKQPRLQWVCSQQL